MIGSIDIVVAQLNPTVGALDINFQKIRDVIHAHQDNELIVFSECITTGYPIDDLVLNDGFMDDVMQRVHQLAKDIKGFAVILPTPWKSDDILYNAALFIQDGEIKNIITKYELPDTGVFDDKRVFTPGALDDPIEFNGHKVGLMICEDLWHPTVSNYLKNQGAEALIVVNGSPYYTEINAHRTKQASSRVEETGLPLLYVNQVGSQDELVFDGRSFTMNEKGKIEKQLPAFKEHIGVLKNHKNVPSLSKEEEIYSALVLGVRDYIEKNGFLGVLIGLSGGIDSALTGAIAVDAIGTEKVQCVMMPSKYTSEDSLEDAKECASLLGVDYDIIPIKQGVEAMDETLINHLDPLKNSLAFENIQSRLRGLILMALSNANGKMLLSTGNKSEMAVGYATLYGDMCGGFNALKDVYKTQVYALAKWRNKQGNVTPERIITKAPSAELKDNQTDQDSLPPYDVLDNILIDLIEHNKAPEDINYDTETVWKVWKLLDRAEYKRRQAPPGTKITAKAFGRDRRYPITNGYFDTKS